MKTKWWQGTIYNEFPRTWIRWHDYVSIMLHNFPFLLFRRWDWMKDERSTYEILFFGFCLMSRQGKPWGEGIPENDPEDFLE